MANGSVNFTISARDAASKTIKSVGASLGGMAKVAKAMVLAVGAATIAATTAVIAFGIKAVKAAVDDAAANSALVSVLKARHLATEKVLAGTNKLIESGAKLAFTDDEIRAGIATATQFTHKWSDAQKILATAQDIARAKNISLEEATTLVGKAYQGNTKGLKALGVETAKGARGLTVLNGLQKQFAGSAVDYSKTFRGQMDAVHIAVNETVESIGYAIGGGEGLPTLTKLLAGLTPVVDDILSTVKANLPALQEYAAKLAAEIPSKVAALWRTIKTNLPNIKDKIQEWIKKAQDFGGWIEKTLGLKGTANLGILAISAKIGGWKAAIGTAFAQGFASIGFDPLTAAIGGAIAAGIASAAVEVAIKALTLKMAAALAGSSVTGSVAGAVTAAGGAAAVGGGIGLGALAVTAVALLGAAAVAAAIGALAGNIQNSRVARGDITSEQALQETGSQGGTPMWTPAPGSATAKEMIKTWNDFVALLNPFDGGRTNSSSFGGTTDNPMSDKYGKAPHIYTNVELMMDGRALATILDQNLGNTARTGRPRTSPGGR
jgi:hypothetical protein